MRHNLSIGLTFWRINVRKDFDIVGSYNNQRVSSIDAERTINMFEFIDPSGKRPKNNIATSGIEDTFLNFHPETGGARASFIFKNVAYQVLGGSLYQITGNTGALTVSKLGSLVSNAGYVGVDANTFQVMLVDGQKGYIWDTILNKFFMVSDTGFPTRPIDVCQLDGFFIVANGQTNNFQMSHINQGMLWSSSGAVTITGTVAGAGGYITIADTSNFRTGVPVTFQGGGIVAPLNTTDTFYCISVYDGANINSTKLQIATSLENARNNVPVVFVGAQVGTITTSGQLQQGAITSHPGNIVACRTLHRRLFLFSDFFTEVWENAGIGTNLPVRRNNNALIEYGTPAIGSIRVGFDRMFFLSQDKDGLGSVMEVVGTEAIPISNRALDYQLAQYASSSNAGVTFVADANGIVLKENGIIFYRLNFTNANHTFVYNVSMSTPENPLWHEEELLNGNRHPAQTHFYYQGINYYGDYRSAKLYLTDSNILTNDGEDIHRVRISRAVSPEGGNRMRIDRFVLDLYQGQPVYEENEDEIEILTESGTSFLTTESEIPLIINDEVNILSDENPKVYLSISKDGGQSYGHKLIGLMGKIGERTFRTVWRKLGTIPRGQALVIKIEFYNHTPFVILGANWDFEIMPE